MFTFKIFEIPDGKSTEELSLNSNDLELGEYSINQATINLEFEKTAHFIRVQLEIDAIVNLTCDRSLEPFTYEVKEPYEVLFKYDLSEDAEETSSAIRAIDTQRNEINIEQDILDTILVHIPAKKLHPRFLDENGNVKEFEVQTFGKPENNDDFVDPRWAALKDLKKQ